MRHVFMPYFALIYDVVDDYVARRAPFRQEHLALARAAHNRGEIVLAGAFANPIDGALVIFKGDNRSIVEDFVRRDPYVVNGLVRKFHIREWTVVVPAET